MTDAEYAVLLQAWDIQRILPYAERHERLVELGGRKGAEPVVNAILVDHLVGGGKYEEAAIVAERLMRDNPSAWSYAAASIAARPTHGAIAGFDLAKRAVEADSTNVLAISAAYTAAALCGDREAACRYAGDLVSIDPTREHFVCLQICSVARSGDLARARDLLANAPVGFTDSAMSWLVTAVFAASEDKFNIAAEHIAKVIEAQPHVAASLLLLAEMLLRANRPGEAEQVAERVLAVNPRDEQALKAMLRAAQIRRHSDLYYKREAALGACTPYRVATEHCRAGHQFLERDQLDAAARAFLMSVDSPHTGVRRDARLGLIRARLGQRRWNELIALLAEFESDAETPPIVVIARASYAASRRDWAEAIRILEAADELNSDESVTSWLFHCLYWGRRFPRLIEVAQNKLANPTCTEQTAFYALLALYWAREVELGDAQLGASRVRYPDGEAILWMQARRLKAKGEKQAARQLWSKLSPAMRRWNPSARDPGPVVAWMRSLGSQFRQRLSRW